MDDNCYEVLSDINKVNMIPIRLKDFEDEELLNIKSTRSFGEYCWTCTPSLIIYIIEKYQELACTYIDADMYFYHNPQILIDDMITAGKSVLIVPHRFTKINESYLINGIYCVEFNTFLNNPDSLEVLRGWRKDCLDCCTANNDGVHFGDQKYLESWPNKYDCVYVCPHLGAGVAPWNIQSYKLFDTNKNNIKLCFRQTGMVVELIFYHFQNITYLSEDKVNIHVYNDKNYVQHKLVNFIYRQYINKIHLKSKELEIKYGIKNLISSHPAFKQSKRPSISFLQRLKNISLNKIVHKLFYLYNRKHDIMNIVICNEKEKYPPPSVNIPT
jgi:hypothetical protein